MTFLKLTKNLCFQNLRFKNYSSIFLIDFIILILKKNWIWAPVIGSKQIIHFTCIISNYNSNDMWNAQMLLSLEVIHVGQMRK